MKQKIAIIGAGGHAKVVADLVLKLPEFELIGFVDEQIAVGTSIYAGKEVILKQTDLSKLGEFCSHFFVAIGNNAIREKLSEKLKQDLTLVSLIHPSAQIASEVTIGLGTVVLANSVINASSIIGENCIINSGTIVDHDCNIGANSHLSIGTKVGSNSELPAYALSEIGQSFPSFYKG